LSVTIPRDSRSAAFGSYVRGAVMDPKPPGVMLLGAESPERALLRAQPIEERTTLIALD
jgi:hypothetical protein